MAQCFLQRQANLDTVQTLVFGSNGNISSETSETIKLPKKSKMQYTSLCGGSGNEYRNQVKIQGCDDGVSWVTDTTLSLTSWGSIGIQSGITDSSYKYWRIVGTCSNGNGNNRYTIILSTNMIDDNN